MPRPLCPGQPSDALALGGAGFPAPREAPGNKCPRGSALRAPGSPRPGGDGEPDGRSEHLCFCLPCPLVPSNLKMGKLVSKMLSKKHHLKGSLQGKGHGDPCLQLPCCCCSVTQSCPALCDPTDGSTPGLPVHHHLLELALTHVHRAGDAIQPPDPLSSPSPPAFNLSQHQGLSQ